MEIEDDEDIPVNAGLEKRLKELTSELDDLLASECVLCGNSIIE